MGVRKKSVSIMKCFYLLTDAYLLNIVYLKGNVSLQQALLFIIMITYILLNIKVITKATGIMQQQNFIKIIALYAYIFMIGSLLPIIHGTLDFSYITMYVLETIGWTLKLLILVVHNEKTCNDECREESFMMIIIRSMLLYIFVSMLMMLIPSLKIIILNNIYSTDLQMQLLSTNAYSTRIGWSGISVYGHSMRCSLAALFSLLLYLKGSLNQEKNTGKLLICFLVCSVGCFFYSRTGLIVNLILLIMALFILIKSGAIKAFSKACGIMLIIVMVLLILLLFAENNLVLSWAMSVFVDLKNGNLGSSIGALLRVLLKKVSPDIFLFGSGWYSSADDFHYMSTDSGFMRNILFMGIIPSIFWYSIFIRLITKLANKYIKKIHYFFSASLLVFFLVFELKGEAYPFILPCILLTEMFNDKKVYLKHGEMNGH